MSLGSNITKYRLLKKWSRKNLASEANSTESYIGYIENDTKVPSLEVLLSIAKALNTTVGSLLGEVPVSEINDTTVPSKNKTTEQFVQSLITALADQNLLPDPNQMDDETIKVIIDSIITVAANKIKQQKV